MEQRAYLEGCEAVQDINETADMLEFKFDPTKQPQVQDIPEGVYFDLSVAPF